MVQKKDHRSYMNFISKLTDLVSQYSLKELNDFLKNVKKGFPSAASLIEATIKMVDIGSQNNRDISSIKPKKSNITVRFLQNGVSPDYGTFTKGEEREIKLTDAKLFLKRGVAEKKVDLNNKTSDIHLFDLLRSKELFPTNIDLANFGKRVLHRMVKRRFDKMSRADIAGRIIEHIETQDPKRRRLLEKSMREAISLIKSGEKEEPTSFFSQWENIIKGIRL